MTSSPGLPDWCRLQARRRVLQTPTDTSEQNNTGPLGEQVITKSNAILLWKWCICLPPASICHRSWQKCPKHINFTTNFSLFLLKKWLHPFLKEGEILICIRQPRTYLLSETEHLSQPNCVDSVPSVHLFHSSSSSTPRSFHAFWQRRCHKSLCFL